MRLLKIMDAFLQVEEHLRTLCEAWHNSSPKKTRTEIRSMSSYTPRTIGMSTSRATLVQSDEQRSDSFCNSPAQHEVKKIGVRAIPLQSRQRRQIQTIDASNYGIGVASMQEGQHIAYFSQFLS